MNALCYETINRSPYIVPEQTADLPAQIEAASAAGFSLIGIDVASIAQHRERGGTLAELASALDAAGLRCFELQPLVVDGDERETLIQAESIAEIAEALRPDWIQSGVSSDVDEAAIQNFRKAAEVLHSTGAKLAIEYLPFISLCSIATTRDFLHRAEVEGARIVVDTWHFFNGPDDWSDLEALTLDELAYPQFDDAPELESDDLMFETTQRRVLPGNGSFDLKRFCEVLRTKGYNGPVSVEILSAEMRTLPPAEFARRVFEAAAPFWS